MTLLLCGGCGSSDPRSVRVAVRGDVTLDGKPLEAGAIVFHCGEGENKLTSFAFIEQGKYEIPAKEGPLVGVARIEFQPKPIDRSDFETALDEAMTKRKRVNVAVVSIPAKYGPKSKEAVTITEDGEHKFDFALTSGR